MAWFGETSKFNSILIGKFYKSALEGYGGGRGLFSEWIWKKWGVSMLM